MAKVRKQIRTKFCNAKLKGECSFLHSPADETENERVTKAIKHEQKPVGAGLVPARANDKNVGKTPIKKIAHEVLHSDRLDLKHKTKHRIV